VASPGSIQEPPAGAFPSAVGRGGQTRSTAYPPAPRSSRPSPVSASAGVPASRPRSPPSSAGGAGGLSGGGFPSFSGGPTFTSVAVPDGAGRRADPGVVPSRAPPSAPVDDVDRSRRIRTAITDAAVRQDPRRDATPALVSDPFRFTRK
jgi:hypothetical protein